ncbi:MAG TPA: hypothetical protein VFG03_18280 [Telluria sp.]|nr:hypothetical protein [Telluria sp.]
MEGDIGIGREALVLLPQWFELHQLTMDNAFSVALLATNAPLPQLADSEPTSRQSPVQLIQPQ